MDTEKILNAQSVLGDAFYVDDDENVVFNYNRGEIKDALRVYLDMLMS